MQFLAKLIFFWYNTQNYSFNLLRKYITAAFFCLGLFSMPQTKAVSYTHTLTYVVDGLDGQGDQLTATVTFDDSQIPADTTNATFDTNFVTNLTYTYTPNGGTPQTITYSDFIDNGGFDRFSFVRTNNVTPVFDGSTPLIDTIDNLQFGSDGGAFTMSVRGTANAVDVSFNNSVTDFLLDDTTYVAPAPLPFLGIIPAFSTIYRLKRRYKFKNNE